MKWGIEVIDPYFRPLFPRGAGSMARDAHVAHGHFVKDGTTHKPVPRYNRRGMFLALALLMAVSMSAQVIREQRRVSRAETVETWRLEWASDPKPFCEAG
jgi:hypothetical protein